MPRLNDEKGSSVTGYEIGGDFLSLSGSVNTLDRIAVSSWVSLHFAERN